MKRSSLFLFFLTLPILLFAQEKQYAIFFKDKKNNSYNLQKPGDFLSAKTLEKRSLQNIRIDELDLPITNTYLQALSASGAKIQVQSKWLNCAVINLQDSIPVSVLNALPFIAEIRYLGRPAQKNKEQKVAVDNIPRNSQNKTQNSYGNAYNQIAQLKGDQLHAKGYRGKGMTIAVFDAGFLNTNVLMAFDSIRSQGQIKGTYDFVENELNVYDEGNHGTNVLSTMAANVPGTIIGTAPDADYWLFRTENDASETIIEEYNWAAAAEFADSVGVDIINSSLGYTEFDDTTQSHRYSDMDGKTTICTQAANIAFSKGILVVNSAGNEGNSLWHYIGAPADAPEILTIGAVDANGERMSFSSVGPTADGRIKPSVAAQGGAAYIAKSDGSYGVSNGTSFSSPIIAGMAACLWQSAPSNSNQIISFKIRISGNQASNPDTLLGYGIPDFLKAYQIQTGIAAIDDRNKVSLSVYPNPIYTNDISIDYSCDRTAPITISIYNTLKQLLYQTSVLAQGGGITNTYSLQNLPVMNTGLYLVNVTNEESSSSFKLFKR